MSKKTVGHKVQGQFGEQEGRSTAVSGIALDFLSHQMNQRQSYQQGNGKQKNQ